MLTAVEAYATRIENAIRQVHSGQIDRGRAQKEISDAASRLWQKLELTPEIEIAIADVHTKTDRYGWEKSSCRTGARLSGAISS
jgi:hypothetical protein